MRRRIQTFEAHFRFDLAGEASGEIHVDVLGDTDDEGSCGPAELPGPPATAVAGPPGEVVVRHTADLSRFAPEITRVCVVYNPRTGRGESRPWLVVHPLVE